MFQDDSDVLHSQGDDVILGAICIGQDITQMKDFGVVCFSVGVVNWDRGRVIANQKNQNPASTDSGSLEIVALAQLLFYYARLGYTYSIPCNYFVYLCLHLQHFAAR